MQRQYSCTALRKGACMCILSLSGTLASLWSVYLHPLSVRLFVWSITRTAIQIFMKFYVGRLCLNLICVRSFGAYRKRHWRTLFLDEDLYSFVTSSVAHLPSKWNICRNETFLEDTLYGGTEHTFYARYTSSRMAVDRIKPREGGATCLLHVLTFRNLPFCESPAFGSVLLNK